MEEKIQKRRTRKYQEQEWSSGHPILTTKINKTELGMVNIHGIISLFSFYPDYIHRLGKI